MSIIHDALKKVQNSNPKSADGNAPVSGAPDSPNAYPNAATAQQIPAIRKPVLITLMTVVSGVVLVLFIVLISLARQTTLHPKIVLETPPTTVTVSVPGQAPPAPDTLRLEGIMNMGAKKVALVNGNIYEEGQTVEGMTIVKVTETNVTVRADGVERVLKINP